MDPEAACPAPGLVEGRFTGRQRFQQTIRDLLSAADGAGWKEIIFCDADFADWPLGELAVANSLYNWSKSGRKLTMLAHDFRGVQRAYPRFVKWRQTWDHVIECRRCVLKGGHASSSLPCVIWTPEWVLHRFEGDHFEAYLGRDAARRFQLQETLSGFLKISTPGFPATTLGL